MSDAIDRNPKKGEGRRTPRRIALVIVATSIAAAAFAFGFFVRPAVWPSPAGTSAAGTSREPQRKILYWTCSMHPQVHQDHKGFCPYCEMPLIPKYEEQSGSSQEGAIRSPRRLRLSPAALALADIRTHPVERRLVEGEVRMVGDIAYDETRLAYITAWVPGRLDRLFVDYTGIAVRPGDHMVYLYSPDLYQAQEELLEAARAIETLNGESATPATMDRARRTLEAAEEKLRLWGLTADQIEEIRKRGSPSDHMTIYAQTGGIVIHKNGVEGMYVQTGTRIYTIADLRRVWLMLRAYESDLSWLRYGQKVRFSVESYPGEVFEGRIAFIEPFLDEKTRSVGVRVNIPNEDGRLKPGMFARARVRAKLAEGGRVADPELAGKWICPMHPEVVRDGPGACDVCEMPLETVESLGYAPVREEKLPLVILASAPLITGRRAVVYVKVDEPGGFTFEGKEIVLGPRAGDSYIVRAGLREGEEVVTEGGFKLDSELQIRAKPSMMEPETGSAGAAGSHPPGAAPIPGAFRESLRLLAVSLDAVRLATHQADLDAARLAYRMLGQALGSAKGDLLDGHAAMQWKELARAFALDAAEGESAATLREARTALDRLERDRKKLLEAFGPFEAAAAGATPAEGAATPIEAGEKPEIPGAFRASLGKMLEAYETVGDRLAADDAAGAAERLRAFDEALRAAKADGLPADLAAFWRERVAEIEPGLKDLRGGEIEKLRRGYFVLSEVMARILRRSASAAGPPIHLFRCPMAFGGKGATWLSKGTEVRNPYFGAAMLTCGEVIETLHGFAHEAGGDGDHE
ncbi:MAG: efflux RND transporter periplasmic adaptor subunit [Planctomycetes bacterium]|nr:efflux RND transporter periplasmic adaptor subunit [Planctomycetota bacterium]